MIGYCSSFLCRSKRTELASKLDMSTIARIQVTEDIQVRGLKVSVLNLHYQSLPVIGVCNYRLYFEIEFSTS